MITQDRGTGGLAPSLTLPRSKLQGRELSAPRRSGGTIGGPVPSQPPTNWVRCYDKWPGMLLAPGTTRKGGCMMSDPAIKLTALADCAG